MISSTSMCTCIYPRTPLCHFPGKCCPDLQVLNLSAVKVTDIALKNLVTKCTKLRSLCLKKCLHLTDKG